MDIQPIRTEADYKKALKAVSPWFDKEPEPGSKEADQFATLLTLIEAWETKHHPLGEA